MKTFSRTNKESESVKKYDLCAVVFFIYVFGISYLLISTLTGVTLADVPTMAPTKLALIGFASCVVSFILDGVSKYSYFEKY